MKGRKDRRGGWFLAGLFALLIASGGGAQERLTAAPEGTFTVAVFSDTHLWEEKGGALTNVPLFAQTAWLAANAESQRIVFVSHAGDLADNNKAAHYKLALQAFAPLHGKVPYAVVPGNHETHRDTGTGVFQRFFGAARFKDFPWYGGAYKNNANSWQTFSGGGLDFVVVHLECNATDDALSWADTVLEQNRKRMAIVVTHMYLGGPDYRVAADARPEGEQILGRMNWSKVRGGNTPEQMWERCFSKHENIFLILSGDQASVIAFRQESKGAHGNVVHEVMANYPVLKDRDDWLRLYRFDVSAKVVRAFTYSPAQGKLCARAWHLLRRDAHLFELDISDAVERFLTRRHEGH